MMRHSVKIFGLITATLMAFPSTQALGLIPQSIKPENIDSVKLKQDQSSPPNSDFKQGYLEEGDAVFTDIQRRFDSYSFEGIEGDTVRIIVQSKDFIPVIWLIDESTEEVVSRQTADAETVSITQQLRRNGTYALQISATEGIGEGDYQFRFLVRQTSGPEAEAYRIYDQGHNQFQLGQFEEAIASLEQALQLYEKLDDRDSQRTILSNISHARIELFNRYLKANDYQRVIEAAEPILTILAELENRAEESSVLGGLGGAYMELENYEKAVSLHQQALEIAVEIEDKILQARALNNLGVTYKKQNEYSQAIDVLERSLEIAEETNNKEKIANALGNLANVYKLLGNYQQAVNYYEKVINILQEIDGMSEQAVRVDLRRIRTNVSLGHSYIGKGNYSQSIQFFQESLRLASEVKASDVESVNDSNFLSLVGLGIAHRRLGNYQLSLNFFDECLQLARQTEDSHAESIALMNIGNVYGNLDNSRKAKEYYEQAFSLSEIDTLDGFDKGQLLRNLGSIYTGLGEYQQAKDYYEQGLAIARNIVDQQGIVSALVGLNEISNMRGYGGRPVDLHREALEIARNSITDPALQADILSSIGNSFSSIRSNDSGGATLITNAIDIDLLKEALILYEKADARASVANTHKDIAHAYLRLSQPEVAEEHLIVATQIYDDLRTDDLADADRVSLFQGQLAAFSLLQEALTEQAKFEAALVAAERGRARALTTVLSQRESGRSPATSGEAPADVANIQKIAQQTESTLVTYSIVRDVDQNYDFNRLFSGYGVGYEFSYSLYVWVTSPSGKISFRQVPLADVDLSSLIADSRQSMGLARGRGGLESAGLEKALAQVRAEQDEKLRQLHDVLIEPIADFLPADPNQPVVFIPQGELFLAPFPALKDDDGSYLIENHTILTAPSIQVLQLTHNLAKSRSK